MLNGIYYESDPYYIFDSTYNNFKIVSDLGEELVVRLRSSTQKLKKSYEGYPVIKINSLVL